jgi:pimeloyl-ACP methyl ester carboxylesterase
MDNELEHQFIRTNGINLHVVFAGPIDGKPVILLHGFPEFWRGWLKQIKPLAEHGYRVIVPDQRGYNQSDVPASVKAYRLEELCKDIVGIIDHLGYEQAALIGHDWGAAVAWSTALFYPERIERLGILNVPHPEVMFRFLSGNLRQMLKSWYIGFFQIPGLPDWLMSLNHFSGALRALKSSGKAGTFTNEDMAAYRQAYQNSGGLSGMLNWYRALVRYRPDLPQNLRLAMPVIILWGKQDIALRPEMADESLAYCDQGERFYFDEATHWVQHDAAEEVTRHLVDFLQA